MIIFLVHVTRSKSQKRKKDEREKEINRIYRASISKHTQKISTLKTFETDKKTYEMELKSQFGFHFRISDKNYMKLYRICM